MLDPTGSSWPSDAIGRFTQEKERQTSVTRTLIQHSLPQPADDLFGVFVSGGMFSHQSSNMSVGKRCKDVNFHNES